MLYISWVVNLHFEWINTRHPAARSNDIAAGNAVKVTCDGDSSCIHVTFAPRNLFQYTDWRDTT